MFVFNPFKKINPPKADTFRGILLFNIYFSSLVTTLIPIPIALGPT